jgi:2-desacetyl-2-hydroxyethyl bacteriochlorophyllide A dehydrogenase
MKAIVLEKPTQFRAVDVEPPAEPKAGEACVRVRRIGICGSDLRAFQGKLPFFSYPRILGHELGVEIVAVGKNERGLAAGDRCAVEPYLNCGTCIACRRGKTNCCVNLKVLGTHTDGGMSEQIIVPISKLHKSETLSLDQLALVEMLSVGAHAIRRAAPEPEELALIIGVGPIGLSVVEFARQAAAEVIVMDINDRRLEFCRKTLHIMRCINAYSDPLSQLRRLSGELPTLVIDCTGSPRSMTDAFGYVAHGGKLIFVGLFPGDVTFRDPDFHSHELSILSSRNATAADFQRVIEQMETGRIDVTPWITHRASSGNFIDAFPQWMNVDNATLKAMVEW